MVVWGTTFKDEATYAFSSVESPNINIEVLSPKAQATHKDVRRRYEKLYGERPTEISYCGFLPAQVLFEDVLPRAGSLDPDAVRKAALATDIAANDTVFGYGVKFAQPGHPDMGTDLEAQPWVEQWQMSPEGKPFTYVVWPEKMAVRKPPFLPYCVQHRVTPIRFLLSLSLSIEISESPNCVSIDRILPRLPQDVVTSDPFLQVTASAHWQFVESFVRVN